MQYENWLRTHSSDIKTTNCQPLKGKIKTDCLVVGGGFTGLHAALTLVSAGKEVVLLEKSICGGGSSGQSAGFLNFKYELRKQNTLYLAFKKSHEKFLKEEAESKKDEEEPYKLLKKNELQKIHPGNGYTIGLKYPGSYGINPFAYCQEMKNLLLKKGVKIYEGSEVKKIEGKTAKTHLGSVSADNILICIDKMKTEFNEEVSKKFHTYQTYVSVSEPLTDQEMKALFPKGEMMCWDTRIIYSHYRPIYDNRILIGGGSLFTTHSSTYIYSQKAIEKFINELKCRFPEISDVNFNYYWSGLIDITQDLEPIVDYDKNNKSIQYALGCAGLPWAAFCGDYIARRVLNPKKAEDLSEFTRIDRKFLFGPRLQKLLGKRISFSLSNLYEYFQT